MNKITVVDSNVIIDQDGDYLINNKKNIKMIIKDMCLKEKNN